MKLYPVTFPDASRTRYGELLLTSIGGALIATELRSRPKSGRDIPFEYPNRTNCWSVKPRRTLKLGSTFVYVLSSVLAVPVPVLYACSAGVSQHWMSVAWFAPLLAGLQ